MDTTALSICSRLAIKRLLPGLYPKFVSWHWGRTAHQPPATFPASIHQDLWVRYRKVKEEVTALEAEREASKRNVAWAAMRLEKYRLDWEGIARWGQRQGVTLANHHQLLAYLQASLCEKQALEVECLTLRTQSTIDALTGILNRRGLEQGFAREFSLMKRGLLTGNRPERRKGARFTAVMFDLDHFKSVNDGQGHTAGDAVICAVAELTTKYLGHRPSDLVGRLGGDEFLVILPDANPETVAKQAEDLLIAMRADRRLQFVEGQPGVTASIGITSMPVTVDSGSPEEFFPTLYGEADTYMYLAKQMGKDRVELATRLVRHPQVE